MNDIIPRIDNNGVIKVADFGLSEEVYTKTYFNQFKDKNEAESVKLPIKWMAIESIHDGIFSEKSDVVSYIYKIFQENCFKFFAVVIWCTVLGSF